MKHTNLKLLLSRYLPPKTVDYCFHLWQRHPFSFKVTGRRKTKLGDYRYDPRSRHHRITVNGTLNRYHFLITYIHEVAHLQVRNDYGRKTAPHGVEWKLAFKQLMLPVLNNDVFPEDILVPLTKHMQNPKATSQTDTNLLISLRNYDPVDQAGRLLAQISPGEYFQFETRKFKKLKDRRTRVLCKDLHNQKNYLITKTAWVIPIELPVREPTGN